MALLALTWLGGCPSPTNGPTDGGHNTDMPVGDGGVIKVQQPGCSIDGWCWSFPQPQGNTLWSVWGSSASDAWAVGDAGAILHYTGGKWQPVVSPTNSKLASVWGSSANDVWAVGDRVTVLHYDGHSWSNFPIATDPAATASCTADAMCAFGQSCNLFKSLCTNTPLDSFMGVWGTGPDDVWIVGENGAVLHKTGGVLTRLHPATPQFAGMLASVWGIGGKVYAVGANGAFVQFDGTNWTTSTISTGASQERGIVTSIVGTDANDIFASTDSGAVWYYNNGSWKLALSGNYGLYGLWTQGTDVFAVGEVQYSDPADQDQTKRLANVKKWNGTTFVDVSGAPPITLFGVWGSASSNLYMVGASGTIVHFDGTNFTSSSPVDNLTGVSGPIVGITGSSASQLTAVGDWGTTLQWNGSQWQSMPSSIYVRFFGISGTSSNLWSVAFDSTPMMQKSLIYQFQNNAWMPAANPASTTELLGIWVSGTTGMAVGLNETMLRLSGSTWSAVASAAPTGAALRGAWGTDASHVWIVGGGDKSDDYQGQYPGEILFASGGATAVPVSGLPQTCTGDTMAGNTVTTTCTLNAVWGSDSSHIFAVGDSGLIVSTSDGSHWAQQTTVGTQFSLHGIWGTSPNDVYVAGEGGTLLHYDGQNWTRQETGTNVTLLNVFGIGKDLYISGYSGAILHRQLP